MYVAQVASIERDTSITGSASHSPLVLCTWRSSTFLHRKTDTTSNHKFGLAFCIHTTPSTQHTQPPSSRHYLSNVHRQDHALKVLTTWATTLASGDLWQLCLRAADRESKVICLKNFRRDTFEMKTKDAEQKLASAYQSMQSMIERISKLLVSVTRILRPATIRQSHASVKGTFVRIW